MFEEAGIPTSEFSNTYGLMSLGGIPKPGWRAFQLLHLHAGTLRHAVTVTEHPPNPPMPPPPPIAPVCHTLNGLNLSANPSAVAHHQDSWATTAATAGACCALCQNTSLCAFWTWAGHHQRESPSEQPAPAEPAAEAAIESIAAPAPSCGSLGNLTNLTANPSVRSLGHHQPSWFIPTANAAACCATCQNTTDCAAWSFAAVGWERMPAKRCYLKLSDALRSPSLDGSMVSGTVRAPAPPPGPGPRPPPGPHPPGPPGPPGPPASDPKCWLKTNNFIHSPATDSSM